MSPVVSTSRVPPLGNILQIVLSSRHHTKTCKQHDVSQIVVVSLASMKALLSATCLWVVSSSFDQYCSAGVFHNHDQNHHLGGQSWWGHGKLGQTIKLSVNVYFELIFFFLCV
eukprot:PhF_6_TR42623/c0_g8_i1/m.64077